MSVRATDRLIGDIVVVTALPKSPQMVVQGIEDKEKGLIKTVWFSSGNEYQEGVFPLKFPCQGRGEKACASQNNAKSKDKNHKRIIKSGDGKKRDSALKPKGKKSNRLSYTYRKRNVSVLSPNSL